MPSISISNSNVLPENLWISAEFLLLSTGPTLDGTNRRPHPYQLLKSPESTAFQCFRGLFIPEMCGLWSFSLHVFHPLVSPCGSRCGSSRKYRANILSDAGLLLLPICPGNSCYFFHEVALFFRKIIAEAKLLANVK